MLIMSEILAPWRSPLQRALHRNRSQIFSHYFALATVTKDGFPANRMVVFRGFLDNSNKIKIITDIRSKKIEHLRDNCKGEICWYFAKTREQFRITGKLELITENYQDENLLKERQKSWEKLSEKAKEQFYWANPKELFTENSSLINYQVDEKNPIANFCLLLFNPAKVDHLELRGSPQNRYIYELIEENKWLKNQVNP